ncbi:recombinase-like helix-turn-helix domain-containing protein [Bradyrhizobium sp. 186]|uniref:recombinase-like helix-turn-helix domain-containing protein n=1 Tax=Bradyrhizobium sp. 186 TaxID=2782654 RepID=UPI0020018B7D|nr:recombinase-like helix-turn-helix domain-containing protein [Bradyrhizobium sp. 186]
MQVPAPIWPKRAVRTAKARSRATDLAPIITQLRQEGVHSLRSLAAGLNTKGITAARGGEWSAAQVRSVLNRITGTNTRNSLQDR